MRVPLMALFCRHPESKGAVLPPALGGVRTCQTRPRPGLGAGKRQPSTSGCPQAPRRGQEPGAGGFRPAPPSPAGAYPGLQKTRPRCPRRAAASCPGPQNLPAAGASAPAPARALPQRRGAASPTWRLRRASRTSQRDPSSSSAGAGGRRQTPARLPPLPGSSPGHRPRTCCAACHGRSGFTAPPQPHNNMAAAASAGSRGGGEVGDPPAAGHRLPHLCEPEIGLGATPHAPEPRGPGPRGPGPSVLLFPRGGLEAPDQLPVTELRLPTGSSFPR